MTAGGIGPDWVGRGKVRARETGDTVELTIDGLTTQAKYYKPLVYEFMRKEWSSRPSYGDFTVEMTVRRPGDAASVVANSDLARGELGWAPRHDDLDFIVRTALQWEDSLTRRNQL